MKIVTFKIFILSLFIFYSIHIPTQADETLIVTASASNEQSLTL